nr:ABC transporter substrate-binding protein [uncultured Acetatifactor sp.]
MKKKVVSVLLTLAMATTMLAGCGDKKTADSELGENYESSSAQQSEESQEESSDTAEESSEGSSAEPGGAAGELDYSEHVDLVFYLLGDAPVGLQSVQDAINEILEEKVNASVEFQFATWTDWGEKYKMTLTTGGADLIYTANWNSFGQLAQSGAFLGLDDLLDTVSPDLKAAIDPAALNGCKVNGEVMTVPCLWKQYTCLGIEYREDLREKYDLPVPDSQENLKAYLQGIKDNDPSQGLLPNGNNILGYETTHVASGAYGQRVYIENPSKIEEYWFSDQFVEDMKLMKEWADLGFWSRSTLSDTTDPFERYENGMFVCMPSGNNPNKYTTRVEAWASQHPEWKTAYHTYSEADGYVWSTTPTADATAITKDCKNPERAMKVLELLIMDKELNLLTQYGIEGVHYEIAEDGTYKNLSPDFGYEALNAWSLRNPAYKLANGQGGVLMQEMFDHYAEVIEEKGTPSVDPFGSFAEDTSSYSAEKAAVDDVCSEYLKPLEAGLVDDVEASVETFREKVKAAGLDTVREGWTKQWQAYVEENGL